MSDRRVQKSAMVTLVPIEREGTTAVPEAALPAEARDVCAACTDLYARAGFAAPWIGYLAVCSGTVVGTCAFKSAPDEGRVEIAYFTFPDFERRGYATAMARELLRIAREHDPRILVTAQTLPRENASTAILRRLGFEWRGLLDHPEDGPVWEWQYRHRHEV